MSEAVRLVIWDLDDTFWSGVLSEGPVRLKSETRDIVIELTRRGIVNSICSKNDFARAKAELKAAGVWDYFVAPSLDWSPKGPRIRTLIEDMGLRAPTVMFVDDNPINLAEAANLNPGLQVASEAFIGAMLQSPLFRGKPDIGLTRLKHYKSLETRQRERSIYQGEVADFLRASHIRATLDSEVADLDRAIELVNRTNQLNFTKRRLPEDISDARRALAAELAAFGVHAGLLRVRDAYGDHGYCGFYLIKDDRLVHFAFSCRILGLGVERWLYERLGRPALAIVGEVASDPKAPGPPIDWIRLEGADAAADAPTQPLAVQRIVVRGGCDLAAIAHYLRLLTPELVGEFNLNRLGSDMRIDHSEFLRPDNPAAHGGQALAEAAKFGFAAEDFNSALFCGQTDADVWLLSFWSDIAFALYRHKRLGFRLPYPLQDHNQTDARGVDLAAFSGFEGPEREAYVRRTLPILASDYEFEGLIDEARFKDTLRGVLARASPGTRIALLTPSAWGINAEGVGIVMDTSRRLDRWSREVGAEFAGVITLNIRDFVADETEVIDPYHFQRIVYVRAYRFLAERLTSGIWAPPAGSWAYHELADPEAALAGSTDADVLTRTAAFLLADGRTEAAERLARRAFALSANLPRHRLVLWEATAALGRRIGEADWRPFCQRGDLSANELHRLGHYHWQAGAFADAETAFRAAAAQAPQSFLHRHFLAGALIRRGRADEALAVLQSCAREGDPDPKLPGFLAKVEAEANRL